MNTVLVDTSIIIDYLHRKDKTKSLFFKVFQQSDYQAVISLITITELWAGKSSAQKETLNKMHEIINHCQVVLPTIKVAKLAGQLLREANYEISYQDAEIAAAAIENKIPILTLNKKDFQKLSRVKLL